MKAQRRHVCLYLLIISLFCISCTKQTKNSFAELAFIQDENFDENTIQKQEFKVLTTSRLGYKNGWYWFKISKKPDSIPLIFSLEGNTIDKIEVYHENVKISDHSHTIDPTNLALKIPPTSHNATYYVKSHFTKHVDFPLKIYSEDSYFRNKNQYYFVNGSYYGFVIMVLIVNLFFYFSLGEKTFLAYCFFVVFTNIGLTDYDGLINLWFEKDVIRYIGISMHFLVPLSSGVFASLLLDYHKLIPRSKIISIITIPLAICFYIAFVITEEFLYFAIGDTIGLLYFSYYMFLGVSCIRKQVFAKFSVVGYSLVFLSAITFVIPLNWGIQAFSTPLYMIKIGALFEMLILSYAITYRVKKIQEENESIHHEIKQYITKIYVLENELKEENNTSKNNSLIEQKIEELAISHNLTLREKDVLLQISKGLNNQQMANELFVSVNTIKYHTRNLYEKLDVKKRAEITSKIIPN
ncbi:7TM diverse intracellular signaling domain-containing protein [Flavicella sediminum]|uniref:7TM diverse intracellular signaling domain-containing protein n=1 Tax=Flavicella sediminum TaxID=2585141 RepID=UPI001120DCB5|nr:7TM diverse intracellular signaling domain-containing protein [Flavicella sediminum]